MFNLPPCEWSAIKCYSWNTTYGILSCSCFCFWFSIFHLAIFTFSQHFSFLLLLLHTGDFLIFFLWPQFFAWNCFGCNAQAAIFRSTVTFCSPILIETRNHWLIILILLTESQLNRIPMLRCITKTPLTTSLPFNYHQAIHWIAWTNYQNFEFTKILNLLDRKWHRVRWWEA